VLLTLGALGAGIGGAAAPATPPSLAESLAPSTWAMSIPTAWLAAPAPRVRTGDAIDVLAVRQGDRAYAVPVAYAARVMAVDERGIVLELDEEGASAIAIARGNGLLLVPLLRSTR
jgi:Flp pilus assembly protein CpaB